MRTKRASHVIEDLERRDWKTRLPLALNLRKRPSEFTAIMTISRTEITCSQWHATRLLKFWDEKVSVSEQ